MAGNLRDQDKALLLVKQAEKLAPTAYDFFHIGRLYNEIEIHNNALSAYLKAYNLGYNPKGPLYAAIASCYYLMDDYIDAIEYSSRVLDINFDTDYAKDVLLRSVEKEGAGSILDSLVKKFPDTCLALILLAQKTVKENNASEALGILSKVEQLNPSPIEMYQVGRLYGILKYFDKALNACFECEKLGYDEKDLLYSSIAGCYLHLEDYCAAIEYSSRALDINFDCDSAKEVLLWSMAKEGAGSILDSLVKKFPDTCLALILLAKKSIREENVSNALEMLTKASQLDPSIAEMRGIGGMYHNLGHYKEALNKYLEVKKLSCNENKESILNAAIADCYISLDDAIEAKKYIQLAMQYDPDGDYVKEVWQEYQNKFVE